MAKYSAENEVLKKKYFIDLKEASGRSKSTINSIGKSLTKYEEFYHHEPFTKFNRKRAIDYKAYLLDSKNKAGDPLSMSTTLHYLKDLQEFLKWLGRRAGYKSKINFADIEYLNLTDKDKRKTQSNKVKIYPALDDIRKVIFNTETVNEIGMRDRALIAFTITTGVRDGVLIGLKLKHINIHDKYIIQNPNEVETKFSKTINTKFFPVGDDIHQVVIDWVNYLKNTKGFSDNHPLFPRTDVIFDESGNFSSNGISKEHWQSVTKIREIFKEQFGKAGLAYHSPHKFRDTLSVLGQKLCNSPEKMMAWCKNLGHEQIGTTFGVYGYLSPNRQFELIGKMAERIDSADDDELKTLLKTYLNR